MLEGLAHIHGLGYAHRNISPHHIFIDESTNRYAIGDLSSCIRVNDHFEGQIAFGASGFEIGARGYRSPELMLRMNHSTATDIFSIGVIVYELFTGKRLFMGHSDIEQFCELINMMGYEELHDWPEGSIALSHLSAEPQINADQKQLVKYLPSDSSQEMLEFIDAALRIDPASRSTARELLDYRWLSPDLEASHIEQSHQLEKSYSDEIVADGDEYRESDQIIGG